MAQRLVCSVTADPSGGGLGLQLAPHTDGFTLVGFRRRVQSSPPLLLGDRLVRCNGLVCSTPAQLAAACAQGHSCMVRLEVIRPAPASLALPEQANPSGAQQRQAEIQPCPASNGSAWLSSRSLSKYQTKPRYGGASVRQRLRSRRVRSESMEEVRGKLYDAAAMYISGDVSPVLDPIELVLQRDWDMVMTQGAFEAWARQGVLSTITLLRTALSRITSQTDRAEYHRLSSGDLGPVLEMLPSAKVKRVQPPPSYSPAEGAAVDAMDRYFKWYPARIARVAGNRVLVRFASWPERYAEWIHVNSGRLAQLGEMSSVAGKPVMPPRAEPCMRHGTTAVIKRGQDVELESEGRWIQATVLDVSEDGEQIQCTEGVLEVNSGRIRIAEPPAPGPGMHKRSLSHLSGFEETRYHELCVDIPDSRERSNPFMGCKKRSNQERLVQRIFRIYERYDQLEFIGKGSYGCVCSAWDSATHSKVAIKRVDNIDRMSKTDAMRTLRELLICDHLRGHENIVKLQQVIPQESRSRGCPLRELYMSFEFMETDLSRFIKSGELEESHIRG